MSKCKKLFFDDLYGFGSFFWKKDAFLCKVLVFNSINFILLDAFVPDGNAFVPDGNAFVPDGDAFVPDGNAFLPDDDAFVPDGDAFFGVYPKKHTIYIV